jgi:hypothetical protein
MSNGGRKEFGRRGVAPPIVASAPQGLPGAPRGPSPFRKRSLAVALISIGAASIGGYALYESTSRRSCASQGDQPQEDCHRSSGGHGGSGSGRGWSFFGSGSGSSQESGSHGASSAAHESGASSHASVFGGFGRMGFGHGGGS